MEYLPSLASLFAGLLFGLAWLLWIDGVAFSTTEYDKDVDGTFYIPGLLSTFGLLMLNVIQWEAVSEDYSLMEDGKGACAKCWVFTAFCMSFGGLIGGIWILVKEISHPDWEAGSVSVAVRALLQNLFIFASSLVFRVARIKADA
eukprot:CAMPEP_0174694900 /NCGR_PEP_ID=MMETSP1094-20130205/1378_1 /TAXON_ID=156173 /ORGANISM="Chrysochromulina brevifilum, Strain UTEX LB 985" /LENGTH=144 /DNA_ID=CAMNT_0015891253 /DNA_START=51 /DNA_END=485 /DNA_ORIENTATION=-